MAIIEAGYHITGAKYSFYGNICILTTCQVIYWILLFFKAGVRTFGVLIKKENKLGSVNCYSRVPIVILRIQNSLLVYHLDQFGKRKVLKTIKLSLQKLVNQSLLGGTR